MTSTPQFPGMPEPEPGLWTDYNGERVPQVALSFSGTHEMRRGNELDEQMARDLENSIGQQAMYQVLAVVTKTGHRQSDTGLVGTAAAKVLMVIPAGDNSVISHIAKVNGITDAARAAEHCLNDLSDALGAHVRHQRAAQRDIPTALEDAHDNLRAAFDALMRAAS